MADVILGRLRWALVALVVLAAAATVGYVGIEGYGWLDALYMTVITMSTVGYGEVRRLDAAGRIFTMAIIIASFATFVYAAATLTNLFTSGEAGAHARERRLMKMRDALEEHVIVVGYGRVGQAAAQGVRGMERPCLVIDPDPATEAAIQAAGCVAFIGDGTSEPNLLAAGIHRAAGLIAAADGDDTNLVVVLTARALRPDLRIVSRVNDAAWAERIRRAGADVAQSPYRSYGMTLAASAVTPAVLDMHELPLLGLGTEEIEVSARSRYADRPLRELRDAHPGVFIVGMRHEQRLRPWHDVDGTISAGDILVVLGTEQSLRALAAET
ncbi:MAG: potassium channel family protein [Acidimicrobiales bacterium]